VNDAPIVSRREQELLDELEVIRRNKIKITVNSFCIRVGYANKSALRHFPVLKRELGLYIAQFGTVGGKGSQPSAVRYLEVQVERLQRKCDRQARRLTQISELKRQIASLQEELKQSRGIISQFRAMISTLISFFSDNDLTRARDISNRLKKLARACLEKNIPSGSVIQDTVSLTEE
jgi:hypothetical protein